ncbi:GDSL-type esterase/lipase family protein [Lachnospiraceae bacterium OttesenSCG-928-D06]|nr:GDSL-type esterase/lipase family protein [Lachnospiraceae bacterium OttesenSCG-928-D06]
MNKKGFQGNKGLMIVSLLGGVVGCMYTQLGHSNFHRTTRVKKGDIKVACVGDSITYGLMCGNWFCCNYPEVLGALLGEGYCVRNFGVSGTTGQDSGDKPYRKSKYYRKSIDFAPNIVVIKFGSNDSKAINWKGKELFKLEYKKLLRSYAALPSVKRILIGTPASPHKVRGKAYYNIRKRQCAIIRDAIFELGEELHMEVIDFYHDTEKHPEWFYVDGIHPQAKGARRIAQKVHRSILM